MRSTRTLLGAMVAVAAVLPAVAVATPGFPAALQRELSMPQAPQCSVCHEGGVTMKGTVVTPFGAAMRQRGLVPNDEVSLVAALTRMREENVDSDGDGTLDVDELSAGEDPNVGTVAPPPDPIGPPKYGCGADATGGAGGALVLSALLLVPLVRRRRTER